MPHSKYSSIQFNSKKLYLDIMTVLHGYMHTYGKKTRKKRRPSHKYVQTLHGGYWPFVDLNPPPYGEVQALFITQE